ncbi:hypothetical protein FSP39_002797 [Pinctada imbricata]|uniref:Uncharacterized protein n=1 Tax=Pinctada imbricata TaxID=66713 RepID=A0AA88Y7T6_PINIB|nr:hypothetical protein FSP39_002797 [Pinctada imbricata]
MNGYNNYRSPSHNSEVYIPMPIDRARIGEKKVEKIQEEIDRLENDQRQRRELIDKLTRIQDVEDRKTKQQNHITVRYFAVVSVFWEI